MTFAEFEKGLIRLGVAASPEQVEQLARYLRLLRKWNTAYNLVAPGDIEHLYARHLLDSLSICPHVKDGLLLDVGTGAGLPGLPLAIVRPDMPVTLLDSTGKKVRFLRHVIRNLGLENVNAVKQRVENFQPGPELGTITARAFSTLRAFVEAVRHLSGPKTQLLAMKGRSPGEEMQDLPDWVVVDSVQPLKVPGLAAERHLVMMSVRI